MAKSSSRKSLKSLFSRSEASLAPSPEKDADKSEAERKKFKFLKLKIKSKKSASENQKAHSAVEPGNDTEDSDAWTDNAVANKESFRLCHSAKVKEFSYSETDLRKPKKFATFSLGLKKKKKRKHEDNISKSTFGLHSPDPDEQNALDLSQMELAQSNVNFSASQPELDTSDVFDIPSPPPVATNRFESNFPLFNQLQPSGNRNAKPDAKEPLKNDLDLSDVPQNPQRAPIAAIPELQLELSEEKDDLNSYKRGSNSFAPTTRTETPSAPDNQAAPVLPSIQRTFVPDTSDHKAAVIDSVSVSKLPYDADILQQSYTNPETSLTVSKVAEAKSSCDSTSTTDAASTHLHYTNDSGFNTYSASIPEQISISERATPETASVTTSSDVSHGKSTPLVNQDKVYGALYESLFPQSFTAEVLSSLLNPPPQIGITIQHLETKLEPVVLKTRDEYHTETNCEYSPLSSSREFESAAIGNGTTRSSPIESYRVTSNKISTDLGPRRNPDIHHRYLQSTIHSTSESVDSSYFPYSDLSHSLSKGKSDGLNRAQDNTRSFPVVQISAPPVSDYSVTSQGADSQVTDSIRRVILIKELVTDKVSADAGCPSPVPAEMNKAKSPRLKIETAAPSSEMDGLDGITSPSYLSVGSDDGSAMEIYYSAEEDNAESGEEETGMFDEREEICLVDQQKEEAFMLCEGFLQQREVEEGHQAELRVLIEENTEKEEKEGAGHGRTEVQPQLKSHSSEAQVQQTGMSEFLVDNDAKSQMKELARQEFPQVKEEGQEERKEELPAAPVQQVNTLMVCDFAPPTSEPHGQQEGPEQQWTEELETEDHPDGEQQLPRQGIEYPADKDSRSSEHMHAVTCHTAAEDRIAPRSREAEEQVPFIEETGGKESKECPGTNSNAARSAVTGASGEVKVVGGPLTHSSEVTEHNRAPQSSEWVDTITQSTDGIGTVPQQVAVELSDTKPDAHQPSESPEHPAGARINPIQGSLTTSRTQKAALEVSASDNRSTKSEQESVRNMNSGYSSLSTKLFAKNSSPPKQDESKQRFRKVSLISEADATGHSQDAVDWNQTSAAATEFNEGELEYKWKNRFEGVSQYKPSRMQDSHMSSRLSDTYYSTSSSSSSSALPESTAYKYHSTAFPSSSLSSPMPEERITPENCLSDSSDVSVSREGETAAVQTDEWRRSLWEREESAAPACERERQREGESERTEARWDTQHFSAPQRDSPNEDDSSRFTGVFKATLVELVSDPAAPPTTPPASPDAESPNQFDMDNLVDTLKSMGPSIRPRTMGIRPPAPVLMSALPPIVEDAPSPVTLDTPDSLASLKKREATGSNPAESQNGLYTLPPDLGLRSSLRSSLSPLELMKQNQDQPETRGLNLPLKVTATNSTVMRKSSDSTPEDLQSQVLNENGVPPPSRLDNSVIFGSQRSDQTLENRHRSLFRTSSLPETGLSRDRSSGVKELELGTGADPPGSRYDRFSFLLNTSTSGSLTGAEEPYARMSRSPQSGIGSPPSNSPNRLLSPTGSVDLQRPNIPTNSPLSIFGQPQGLAMGAGAGRVSAPILQRSFSSEGAIGVQQFNSVHGGPQFKSQEREPEKNLALKYRAFPDAYLTKEKEHGKLNPRPGKMYIFDRPGMCGQRIEVRGDVIDATTWELQETISIRVVRGGWVLYEKPNFKGEKFALDEGDMELTNPFSLPEEQLQNGHQEERPQGGEPSEPQTDSRPPRRFIIGSIRRAVRDYSVPEISLFPEENAEGKKVIFRDTSDDARIFGFPIKANSIIVNAGLWLVFAHPFFQGAPRVLEVGGYTNPEAWGVDSPYVGSVHPLKIGEPRVENTSEPKMIIYDKPYFTGKSRTITTNMRDFMTRTDRQQTVFMYSVGSIKVLGGIWVGYEKEGFRGHQYLLEEGEYHDWRVWGGCDSELRSVRVIRADLTDPLMVMFELPEEEQEDMQENTFEVKEAIPDVELFEYKTSTRSIHVVSGAWIAYSHVDFSGNQYILEKGFYNNCADWGSQDNRICSVQPILLAPSTDSRIKNEVILYPEPDFQGDYQVFDCNQEALSEKLLTKSCRVSGGSWVFYEEKAFSGNLFVLSEGDYPNVTSMGCLPDFAVRSIKAVPMTFSVPSISLFGLECLEGREITMETEILSMVEEGFNNHVLSVKVNSGCWVICEHSNFRGRQFILEPIEITNWLKFSSLQSIGSMFPVRQKRHFFRIRNKESGHFMSIQGGVEEMKSGRVVVTPEAEPMSDIWFYQDGLLKSKLSPTMSLQVMGNIEPAAKVVLWSETRQPIQTWTAQMTGLISSLTFPGMMLDVKGGKTYDKDHVVIMPESEERPGQQWEIELV